MQINALKYDNALTVIAAQSYNIDSASPGAVLEPRDLSTAPGNTNGTAALEDGSAFLKNLTSNYTSEIILLDINGELVHTGIYIWLFMAALCIIAQT